MGKSWSILWDHCSFLLGLCVHRLLFVPSKSLFLQSCVGSGGSMVGLMVTSSKKAYSNSQVCCTQIPCPATEIACKWGLFPSSEKAMVPHPITLAWKIHGWRSLVGCSPWVAKSWTCLSNFIFTFYFHALENEMATHSSILAWRIPGMAEPGGLPSMGSHKVGHN